MTGESTRSDAPQAARDAVATLYNAFFTGLVLAASMRSGSAKAAELVYRIFDRQRARRFLPGLAKLGLDKLPHAVAAAQYHYLSNNIGGVAVQYMPESERKAWIRYVPPRWAWAGTALCGVPPDVSTAMLRGWHARNGLALGNPRLGFVCTRQTADGQSALEGYYYEYDHPLEPAERLRFARAEEGPDFDPAAAPVLASADWPAERLARARRNYAMEYIRTALPVAVDLYGPADAAALFTLCARQVGMQFHDEVAQVLGAPADDSAQAFAAIASALGTAQGDRMTIGSDEGMTTITQSGWTLFGDEAVHPAVVDIWHGLAEGMLVARNRRLALEWRGRSHKPPFHFEWRIRPVDAAPF
ncbi:MAG: hypothetical protein WCZ28_04305 [Burkholderiaceae bacterium]